MITPNEVIAGSGENTLLIGSSPVVGTTPWHFLCRKLQFSVNSVVKLSDSRLGVFRFLKPVTCYDFFHATPKTSCHAKFIFAGRRFFIFITTDFRHGTSSIRFTSPDPGGWNKRLV
jgi:hypothetical protein